MDWPTVAVSLLGSVLTSAGVAAYVTQRMTRSRERESRQTKRLDTARTALAELRTAYRQVRDEERSDSGLVELEEKFDADVDKCVSSEISERAREYKEVGRLFSKRDNDHGVGPEQEAYDRLVDQLQAESAEYLDSKDSGGLDP